LRAVSLTDELLKAFEHDIESLELIPSTGGVFEVEVNGALIYSKKANGRHALTGEVLSLVEGIVNAAASAAG
jgi:selenoprotein W-related protein